MKTLYELALHAVPNPGMMAKMYLVPHHPAAIDLEARQFREDRARWQQEHRAKFRLVYIDLQVIQGIFSSIRPSDVKTFNEFIQDINKRYAVLFLN